MCCCPGPRARVRLLADNSHAPGFSQKAARGADGRQRNRNRPGAMPSPRWRSWALRAWKRWPSSCAACSATWARERRKTRKLKIKDALKQLVDEEAAKLVNEEASRPAPLPTWSKTASSLSTKSTRWPHARKPVVSDISRQGVQRDFCRCWWKGTTVSTKYGMVKTDHILFIASGAFHLSKPSDLIPGAARALSDPRGAAIAVGARL